MHMRYDIVSERRPKTDPRLLEVVTGPHRSEIFYNKLRGVTIQSTIALEAPAITLKYFKLQSITPNIAARNR